MNNFLIIRKPAIIVGVTLFLVTVFYSLVARASDGDVQVGVVNASSGWRNVGLSGLNDPIVIVGPADSNDPAPGVVRMRNVGTRGFDLRFQEWIYLDQAHGNESVAWLAVEKGRTVMPDGTILEAGTFSLNGNRTWKKISFSQAFPGTPTLLLSAQTAAGGETTMVKAKAVDANSFNAALQEEEALVNGGHTTETVGYLAVYDPDNDGQISLSENGGVTAEITRLSITHDKIDTAGRQLWLEEEKSKDSEIGHISEMVDSLIIGQALFAQIVSDRGRDSVNIRMRGVDGGGVTPDNESPSVPGGLQATKVTTNSVELNWSAASDNVAVTGYRVLRNGTQIAEVSGIGYTDTGLTETTSYQYQVLAFDAAGNVSGPGAMLMVTTITASDTTAPSVPNGLQATKVTTNSVKLNWSAASDNVAVTGYRVLRDGKQIAEVSSISYTDTGLGETRSYQYQVLAFDAAGNVSGPGATLLVTTLTASDTTAPSVPNGLQATKVTTNSVKLNWSAASDNVAVTGYRVLRNGTQIAEVSGIGYTDIGLTETTSYQYQVLAFDAAGNVSGPGATLIVTTLTAPDTTAPSVPNGLQATEVTTNSVKLNWSAASDNVAVTGYRVLRNGTQIAEVSGIGYTDIGLTETTSYQYQVLAFDAAGNASVYGAPISATTQSNTSGGGNITEYVPGYAYAAEDVVSNHGGIYRCKGWPYTPWCSQAAYEPGVSSVWAEAWIYIRDIEDNGGNDLDITEYVPGYAYAAADVVSNRGGIYRCKGWPYTPWCSQAAYEPGNEDNGQTWWKDAWEYLGADEIDLNSSRGQIAVTLPGRPDASLAQPQMKVNGESFTLAWGSRTLLKTMPPGTYQLSIARTENYLPGFIEPTFALGSMEVSLTAGEITEVVIDYQHNDDFARATLQTVCSQCHFDANRLDTEVRAEKWLFNFGRSDLVTRISQMRGGTACTGECSEVVADHLRNNVWEVYREDIANRIDSGGGLLPDNKGKRIVRLLTRYEYLSTIKDALGVDLPVDDFSDYVPGRHLLFQTIHDRTVTDNQLLEYINGATRVENLVDVRYFTQCDAADAACIVETAGLHLFHRPLTASEMNRYISIAENESLPLALSAMTMSPNFLYRTEMGEYVAGEGYQLTQYEIAAAMSYAFTGRGPDELLLELARRGDLTSPVIREIQAERLLESEQAKDYLPAFFEPLIEVSDAKLKLKDGIMSPDLINDMREEMKHVLADVVINNRAGINALFNPGFTYLNNDLANHYGIDAGVVGDALTRVETDSRNGGLLHLGIFHTSNSSEVSTHLIRRSRVVRENLLCKDLGTPVGTIPEQIEAPELASSRDFWTQVNGPDSGVCWSCHKFMNDIGFALDSFDIQGRYRTTETVQGIGTREGDQEEFELLTYGSMIIDGGEASFFNLRDMVKVMAISEQSSECLSTRYLQFARGYEVDASDVAYTKHVYDEDGTIFELMDSLVVLPSFINKE